MSRHEQQGWARLGEVAAIADSTSKQVVSGLQCALQQVGPQELCEKTNTYSWTLAPQVGAVESK